MNPKIIEEWAELIGEDRAKLVANAFMDQKIDLDFPLLKRGDFIHIRKSIIAEVEEVGTILQGLDSNILDHDEVIVMVDLFARDLIAKSLPEAFVKAISELLVPEKKLIKELDDEIDYIKAILERLKSNEEEFE